MRVPKASAFPFSAPGTETRLRGEGWRSRDLLRPRTQRLCSHNRRPHPNRLSASASGAGAGRPRGQRLPPCQPRRVCARRNERLASLAYSPISGQQGTPHAWFPLASDPRGRRCGAWRHRGRGLRKEWIRHWRNEPIRRGQRRVEASQPEGRGQKVGRGGAGMAVQSHPLITSVASCKLCWLPLP